MKFSDWGGVNRVTPMVINFLRNNVFGSEFVLDTEKKLFSFRDGVNKKVKNNIDKSMLEIDGDTELNSKLTALMEEYVSNNGSITQHDMDLLNLFAQNYYQKIPSVFPETLEGEGVWEKFGISPSTFKPLYAKTFIRPDTDRRYSMVYLYKFDMDRLKLDFIPGNKDAENPVCTGEMNSNQKKNSMWIFSGGFQYIHGYYGMKYLNNEVLPPREDAATLLFYSDGSYRITKWQESFKNDRNIYAYRQNEFMLVIDGQITPDINKMWGLTPKNVDPIYTVRSGLGFTKNNEMVFAFGDSLSADTLAKAMIMAGVINGMHLDMNYFNVHLVNVKRTHRENGELKLWTFNENKTLSFYKNIYTYPSPRDYFVISAKDPAITGSTYLE